MSTCANTACMEYSDVTDVASRLVTLSVVSHGQGEMVAALLRDLERCAAVHQVLLTQNIPEPEIDCPETLRSRLIVIRNDCPKGFAANHNQAFRQCNTPFFAVVNPDIRLGQDPFPMLIDTLLESRCALAAPAVRNPAGAMEDSARHFPTPFGLLAKLLHLGDGRYHINGYAPASVDWVAGMFMLLRADAFRELGGFDEGFFLYYEDVDFCIRLRKAGWNILIHPGVFVTHAAQRASRRQLRYLVWHLSSMARYFYKHLGRLPRNAVTA